PGLESDASAAEEDEQRGNRGGAQKRERHMPDVGVPGELEVGYEDAGGDRGNDPDRFLDRGVTPDRAVEADDLVEEELRRDRDQKVRNCAPHAERRGARKSCEIAEEPGGADDAEVEHSQARCTPSAR